MVRVPIRFIQRQSGKPNAEGSAQKKRGRPKKSLAAGGDDPFGPVLSPTPLRQFPLFPNQPHPVAAASAVPVAAAAAAVPTQNFVKRPRGRPLGSGKKRTREGLDSVGAPSGNPSGLGLRSTPVVNQAVPVAAVPSGIPPGFGFPFTQAKNQADYGAAPPSGNPSDLGLPPTPVASQPNTDAAPSENPSGLGFNSTPVVNRADFVSVAPTGNPAKRPRGRPPGFGKKQRPEASGSSATASQNPAKTARGRPPASGKEPEVSGAVGLPNKFTITVDVGEDIMTNVIPFIRKGSVAVCVVSATGNLSKATVRESPFGGGTVMFEGLFGIASLSGSFYMPEGRITGGLNVTLHREDGSDVGGVVAGPLMAATRVEVLLSTFIPDTKKPEPMAPSSTPPGAPVTEPSSSS